MKNLVIEITNLDEKYHEVVMERIGSLMHSDPYPDGTFPDIWDITEETNKNREVAHSLIQEAKNRVPADFDKMTEEYVDRVKIHNKALVDLANALFQIGYKQ